ncbi:MAG: hypothetical protein CM15mP40_14050 [Alphaproteobacteria bacterium]|nr:MAG: hypothetical protein CM15mP40_14050 [Alphaproteobacteria bacterium]
MEQLQSQELKLLSKLTGDEKDSNLIGIGVGFTPVLWSLIRLRFQAKKQEPKKFGKWVSDGKSGFEITKDEKEIKGTTITFT